MEQTKKPPMTTGKKILLGILAIAAAVAVIWLAYYLIHYRFFNRYKKYLVDYETEIGKEFVPINEAVPSVPGYVLVTENEFLKLYTDTETGFVAVYDKRDGNITYSNPVNADQDKKAKDANKNLMKSAFILSYFNDKGSLGSFNSYVGSVLKGGLSYEGLENGIRYTYRIGDLEALQKGTPAAYFDISLEYRLDGPSLVVNVPSKLIKEPGTGYVNKIQLLQYFGAASIEEEGYIVVPNGSGSTIDFYNGRATTSAYTQYYYDRDPLNRDFDSIENLEPARLDFFGICRKDSSILVTMDRGTSVAQIYANSGGAKAETNYAYCCNAYTLRNVENLKNFGDGKQDVLVLEKEVYNIDVQQRYTFLGKEYTGYSGIANYKREQLLNEGALERNEKTENTKFYYDILAGVKGTVHVLGIQTLQVMPVTTFAEAGEIATELDSLGVKKQVMNLQGWFNKGYYHETADTISVVSKLGGKSGLKKLENTVSALGGKVYGDVAFQKQSYEADFNYSQEGSRYYGAGYVASFGLVSPASYRATQSLGYRENVYDLMSPKYLPRYVDSFAKRIQKYSLDGISLRDLGDVLCSDKRRTEFINREYALDVVKHELQVLEDTGKDIMMQTANAYAFPYADDIINAPLKDNKYNCIDEQIPLYEMIIHGCIDYSSSLLNFEESEDITPTLLSLVESGACVHYVFTKEESSAMKNTALNRYYCTTFDNWKAEAAESYKFVNGALKYVTDAYIVNHETVLKDVKKVTYDNGVVIYVNYNETPVTVDGITIKGLSYEVEETK